MAKYIQTGGVIDYKNNGEAKINAGDVVALAGMVAVAACDIPVGALGTLAIEGVFEFDKTTSLTISVGDVVYFNTSTEAITKTATDVPCGVAIEAGESAATSIKVKLAPVAPGTAANVAYAAGSAPTAAEFKALIDALIAAGLMAAPST